MTYTYIDPSRYDADSPITESLMSDIIGNIEDGREVTWIELTSGTSWTVPTGITQVEAIIVGGGGGGGGGAGVTANNGGGGGGSGCVIVRTVAVFSSVSYSIGAGGSGGAGGSSGANGTDGGDTTFGSLTAKGGRRGGGGIESLGVSSLQDDSFNVAGGNGGDATPSGESGETSTLVTGILFGDKGAGGTTSSNSDGGGGGAPFCVPFPFNPTTIADGGTGGNGATGTTGFVGTAGDTGGAGGGGGGGGGSGGGGAGSNGGGGIIYLRLIS